MVLALLLTTACGRSGEGSPPGAAPGGAPGGAPPPMPVAVIDARPIRVPTFVEAVGTAEGAREVEVRARVAGILQRQLYREGEVVGAGAALFQIERAGFEIALEQARAALAQAQAQHEQATRESNRLKPLAEEQAIPRRDYDQAVSALRAADAGLMAARSRVREAELNLGYTRVTAPIAGVVQRAQRSEGTLVSPSADASLLTTIAQTNPIRVRFALSEAEAAQLRASRGQQVRVLLADGRLYERPGKLDYAGSVVDARLGTVQMRAEFANPEGVLLPGQFVRVQLVTGESEAYLVPQAAVMSGEQGRFVWVIGPQGQAAPKPVQTAQWQGSDWVIRSGLAAGDKVIVDNLIKLRPGAPVQAAAPASGAASAPAASSASAPGASASR
jgi:membrane fusion protein, multidrug efflux system